MGFSELVKIMGLCLAPEVWFQADRLMGQPDRFQRLIGTREGYWRTWRRTWASFSRGTTPGDEPPAIRLCPHALMDRVWEARRAGSAPAVGDVLSDGSLVARAYRDDVAGIPVLGDLEGFQDFARQLEPETFSDMVKRLKHFRLRAHPKIKASEV